MKILAILLLILCHPITSPLLKGWLLKHYHVSYIELIQTGTVSSLSLYYFVCTCRIDPRQVQAAQTQFRAELDAELDIPEFTP